MDPRADAGTDDVLARVRDLLATHAPPDFAHVPDVDSALFLCAVDHKAGYERSHVIDGEGPVRGSELMWLVGLRAARERRGFELRAGALADIGSKDIAAAFAIDGDTVADPERRATLWRDLAAGLLEHYGGRRGQLNAAADGRLGGEGGLLERLRGLRGVLDPLAKKAQLYAKICERRRWFEAHDPEAWEVSADSVLMRVALRSGLVAPGRARRGPRRDPCRIPPHSRPRPASARRSSTTCSGSSAARTRTSSAPPRETCASPRAIPGSAWY